MDIWKVHILILLIELEQMLREYDDVITLYILEIDCYTLIN